MKKIFIGAVVWLIMFAVISGVSYRMEKLDSRDDVMKYQNKLAIRNS